MMMNDPLISAVRIAKSGGNPSEFIRQMAGRDPRMRQAMQMINGKNPQQLRQMAENMCRECGTTVDDVARQLGLM